MSTRGLWGLRKNAMDKCVGAYCDAYPDGLGRSFTHLVADVGEDGLLKIYAALQEESTDQAESTEVDSDFQDGFRLLREAAIGDITRIPFINRSAFILDSLMCEWAYIANLDSMKLGIWEGWQTAPDPENRYGTSISNRGRSAECYPCRMIKQFDFNEITPLYADKLIAGITM